jgi:hypothetical protein
VTAESTSEIVVGDGHSRVCTNPDTRTLADVVHTDRESLSMRSGDTRAENFKELPLRCVRNFVQRKATSYIASRFGPSIQGSCACERIPSLVRNIHEPVLSIDEAICLQVDRIAAGA